MGPIAGASRVPRLRGGGPVGSGDRGERAVSFGDEIEEAAGLGRLPRDRSPPLAWCGGAAAVQRQGDAEAGEYQGGRVGDGGLGGGDGREVAGCAASPQLLRLGDLAPTYHRDSDGNRLEVIHQIIGLIDNIPSRKRTVRSGVEPDALLTGREYHAGSAVIFALVQTSEDGLGRGNPSNSQRVSKIRETVRVTQQVGKLPDFLLEQLFRRESSRHASNPIP